MQKLQKEVDRLEGNISRHHRQNIKNIFRPTHEANFDEIDILSQTCESETAPHAYRMISNVSMSMLSITNAKISSKSTYLQRNKG